MKYEVPITYTGQCNFIVDAPNAELARGLAEAAFKNGDEPVVLGNEWEEIERVGQPTPVK